jgi:hypothetical protein
LFFPPGVTVMRCLGLAEALFSQGARLQQYALETADGHTVRQFDLSQQAGFAAVTLHRADLQKFMLDALQRTSVQWGRTVREVQPEGE